jgi:hypothetical protein
MRHRLHVAFLSGVAVLTASSAPSAGQVLRLQVSPSVSRAPADLVVRVSVEAASENRFLRVVAESTDFYRSSEVPMDGERTPPLSVFEFRNLPPGLYQVTGVLVGTYGRLATVSRLAKVEPNFSR